jgi:hypothetical protein
MCYITTVEIFECGAEFCLINGKVLWFLLSMGLDDTITSIILGLNSSRKFTSIKLA